MENITYEALSDQLTALAKSLDQTEKDMNVYWLLLGGSLVFFMQCGFGMLEAGCVRSTSVVNIVFKNLMDACIGAFFFYVMGWALAYGDDTTSNSRNAFVGNQAFFLTTDAHFGFQEGVDNVAAQGGFDTYQYALWFYQFAFCATAGTIVSGAMAERTQLNAYFVYSAWICGFVYPIVVHWCWSSAGWASPFVSESENTIDRLGKGLLDFAGSGVVHMVGGFSALAGAILVGPRRGREVVVTEDGKEMRPFRFDPSANPADFSGHNMVYQTLGMFILWAGWYGFNCCSTLAINEKLAKVAAKVATTTTLGAAGGSLMVLLSSIVMQKVAGGQGEVAAAWLDWANEENAKNEEQIDVGNPPPEAYTNHSVVYDLPAVANGVLAGLVSITAGCAVIEPWAALVIGMIGGAIYFWVSKGMVAAKVDDPLDAFAVHGACGFWGLMAVGLFATETNVAIVYGNAFTTNGNEYYGAFYGGDGKQFGIQLLVGLVIAVWSFSLSGLAFVSLKYLDLLRAPDDKANFSIDEHEHGAIGYTSNK